ncbi:glycerol-3-phosphate 1-O-acyltransferase PlsY [Siccirubricoccus sp. KC 17139]|uniref:Glycerol-3-phosphate acyltransferase n=1 Tax=Siccirubricoccus soli TaxID=2899147 RepID=A0ABT1D532_9PROT|nr:glycerol-3-phosphate 1-O-acyltransferase PlsY [Siccirubricoccus soli]MCO6416395.1 glycerol-3-phosphate 1-O-acyltransferase PlsY [Siccirubricoccus soli]MCP2682529.1 glycerol-3-phosphate 1-O-acyltransferase PlsY [Siccirubricoccus soli]
MDALHLTLPTLLAGYLLGSIPFGLLLTRLAGLGDLRQIGSGNIGATNVLRTGHKGLAAATLILDLLKGVAAVWLGDLGGPFGLFAGAGATTLPYLGLIGGFGAMLGHAFPVWLGFKGGKGVATGGGVLLAGAWWLGLGSSLVWLATVVLTRISSAGAIAACAAAPLIALAAGRWDLALFSAGIAALVIYRHKGNIQRLLAGTEPKVGRKG